MDEWGRQDEAQELGSRVDGIAYNLSVSNSENLVRRMFISELTGMSPAFQTTTPTPSILPTVLTLTAMSRALMTAGSSRDLTWPDPPRRALCNAYIAPT
jgi:hypothetical protein